MFKYKQNAAFNTQEQKIVIITISKLMKTTLGDNAIYIYTHIVFKTYTHNSKNGYNIQPDYTLVPQPFITQYARQFCIHDYTGK